MDIRIGPDRDGAPALELVDVVKRFGSGATEVRALTDVSLTVAPGELVAVMGPSGCGKSTLLHLAGGLEDPTAGQVRVAGLDVPQMPPAERAALRRTEVGYVFQRLNLVVTLTALENVMLPLSWRASAPERPRRRPARRSPPSGSRTTSTVSPTTSPAASSSASRWPGPWPAGAA